MPARTPEEIDTLFLAAMNAGDLDALVALYEPQATLTPSPGRTVTGRDAIRDSLAAFLAVQGGQSVEVARRQADGTWLFVIDLPFGMEASA